MNNLTLKQLRYFLALAQQGHFGRAAELCAISQPALSMQIKELEETLGTPLFERSARQIRLTQFGEALEGRAKDILRAVDELDDLARAAQDRMAGRLRLGIIPTIAPYLLPRLITALDATYPALDIHVRETITPKLVDALEAGQLDAAIVALPISEPAFAETPLFDEPFVFVRPQADAHRPVPNAETLKAMRLLLLEEGHCFRDQALAFCEMQTSRAREGLEGSSLSTLVQMVGVGLGVTLLPQMAVKVEARSAPVDIARFPDPQPKRTIGMIWRNSTPLATQFEGIAEMVRKTGRPAG